MADEDKQVEKSKKAPQKGKEHDADFKYIVRIANTDINGERPVIHALTGIKGVGPRIAFAIAKKANVPMRNKIGSLSDAQIESLKEAVTEVPQTLPTWLLNRRNDIESGEDIHMIGTEIGLQLRDDINMMKKIRCYKGIKHELGHKVRGQKSRSNGRKGLTLGVSRKKGE